MEDEAVRMSWLSGRPQRVFNLRPPPEFSRNYCSYGAQWSVMDDQILLTFEEEADGTIIKHPSSIFLADVHDILGKADDVVEFRKIVKLPFNATRSRLLSHRAGFVTAEFRKDEKKLLLRTHDWDGNTTRETTVDVASIDGQLVVNDSSVALCVDDEPKKEWCISGCRTLSQIAIWNLESGDITRMVIPQDERAPQCHSGNFTFVTPSCIALGGHLDPDHDRPYALLRSFSTNPSEKQVGRLFRHGQNFEFSNDNDALAISGSSASSDIVVHFHHSGGRFTVADKGLLTGEIPSESLPTPGYFIDPDLFKDLWHVFMDKFSARTLPGVLYESLASLAGNKLLAREDLEHEHDEEQYSGFHNARSFGEFQILYLYDFDQNRCNKLRQLSPDSERADLAARLKGRNPDARVTVVSRMSYMGIEEAMDMEEDTSPEWAEHVHQLWVTNEARGKGEAEFPVLEFDDPPKDHKSPRMLYTRTMLCLPEIREGQEFALTTSAIIELPTHEADGYVHYFGEE
ncbi:hypothetical protein TGAM01_v200785 [Trichoderma gamsii]|uniref:Uncharacterized protein n=1 Tax=Trichoderma gamsii TaxID=398673 RepID=A0A2P5A1B3_9HYPO|nr:hypothetical protein TGAM01_v200785 [Trichoderma gamsii]PON30345.1 hypothetical protein TGAM01_v200785 [Trichoderma gamsii]